MLALALMLAPAGAQEMEIEHGHLESSFGFQVGERDYGGSSWGPMDAKSSGLVAPFARHPFEQVTASGFHVEERLVWNQIRMGVGYRRTFPEFSFQRSTHRLDGSEITVQDFASHQLRMTVGAVAPTTPVAPYLDVAGDLTELRATLGVDGEAEAYRSSGFGLALVGGVRAQMGEHAFLAAQGEYAVTGTGFWGIQAAVGFNVL